MRPLTPEEHPDRRLLLPLWKKYRDLYLGGERFCASAAEYLTQRHHEPNEVYMERLSRAYYENYVGSIIDWYAATLFRREPVLALEGDDAPARAFFNSFAEDCDRRGTALSDFFRRVFVDAQVTGKSHVLVDFPRHTQECASRAEEDQAGLSRAYLVQYPAEQLIDWERNDDGDFKWVVLELPVWEDARKGPQARTRRRFVRYDQTSYTLYERIEGKGREAADVVLDEGRHGFAGLNRVPLFELDFSSTMWLMNRAAPIQLEHFNKSNGLGWALTMGLFAMPVVYSDREFDQIVGESYYIQLGAQDRFGWTEPEGNVFEIAAQNLDRLKDEIYRVCYLTHQAGGSFSSASSSSGLSKQRDYAVTQEVLRGFGDSLKDLMKRITRSILQARQDSLSVHVTGLDEFDIGDFTSELTDATTLLSLGIPSPTFTRQLYKKLALKYLCDASQELKDCIAQEIEQAAKERPEEG